MARIKSLLTTVEIDIVQRAHNCQGNPTHRLSKGDRRLAVKKERGWDYYCMECAVKILKRDGEKIKDVLGAIAAGQPPRTG